MRLLTRLLAAMVAPALIGAQDVVPKDWTYRLDADQVFSTGDKVQAGEWRYTRMPPGWHVTTTAQGVSMFPKAVTVEGRWGIEVEVFLFADPSDAPFGVVLEAADAPGGGSMELRFLMRRDGQASVLARHGDEDVVVVPWTADTNMTVAANGAGKFVLRVMHQGGNLSFAINGRQLIVMPTGGEDHVSMPGFRVGPGLNLHVSRYDLIRPLAPVREQ